MKKTSTEIQVGNTIQSQHFKCNWLRVDSISESKKKITFMGELVEGGAPVGTKADYTFLKTTKVIVR